MVFLSLLDPSNRDLLHEPSAQSNLCDTNIMGIAATVFGGVGFYCLLVASDRAYLKKSWTAHAVVGASLCMGSIVNIARMSSCDSKNRLS